MYLETLKEPGLNINEPVAAIVALVVMLVVLIIALVIWFKICKNMSRIAADKGYTERRWFHYCFWLGMVGFLMIIAMPDKNRR